MHETFFLNNSHQAAAQLCPYPEIHQTLLKWRNASQPPLPKSLAEISHALASEQWQTRLTYKLVVADKATGTTHTTVHTLRAWETTDADGYLHVVLGTKTFASTFLIADYGFVDATYNVVPNVEGGYQLLTIMVERNGTVFPVAWALMSRKTEVAYRAVLGTMRDQLLPSLQILNIMTDFEPALQNSLKSIFPDAVFHGCFFHHCHAIMKYRQKFAMMTRVMRVDEKLRPTAVAFERDLMNLAFLPATLIPQDFNELRERLRCNEILYPIMRPLFDYYESYWIGKIGPTQYSIFDLKHRTNNVIERYHRSVKEEMATNPELYKFLDSLKRIQERYHLNLLVVEHDGVPNKRAEKKSVQRQEKIKAAWESLRHIDSLSSVQQKLKIRQFLEDLHPENIIAEGIANEPLIDEIHSDIDDATPNGTKSPVCHPQRALPQIVNVERIEQPITIIPLRNEVTARCEIPNKNMVLQNVSYSKTFETTGNPTVTERPLPSSSMIPSDTLHETTPETPKLHRMHGLAVPPRKMIIMVPPKLTV